MEVGGEVVRAGSLAPLVIPALERFLALAMGDYWMNPCVGCAQNAIPANTQFLLWEREEGGYGVLIPLVEGDLRSWIEGGVDGVALGWDGACPGSEPDHCTVAYTGTGPDPFELVRDAMAQIARRTGTLRLREEKKPPAFMEYLGWCTWDAFYQTVDAQKVCDGLRTFRDGGVQCGCMILDDGWLDTSGDLLNALAVQSEKFPNGLQGLIRQAREEYGIVLFGIWHAFMGYWAGINPQSELAQRYRCISSRGVIRPWEKKVESLNLIDPGEIDRFYREFYEWLSREGVDAVKCDGQSALHIFTGGHRGRGTSMRAYQQAFQDGAARFFDNNALHCMCHGSDVALNMSRTALWRSSTDYFPGKGVEVQQKHLVQNALDSVWIATFAFCDWDMFQTHGPCAELHAVARAVSGGPVYVCDKPGMQDFSILKKLTVSGGRVLRCLQPALPARDSLFFVPESNNALLKVTNHAGGVRMGALFHCSPSAVTITDTLACNNLPSPETSNGQWALYRCTEGECRLVGEDEQVPVTLEQAGYEVLLFSPVSEGVAAFGLIDKYNPPAAIARFGVVAPGVVEVGLVDGGCAGFFCEGAPRQVLVDGAPAAFEREGSLVRVTLPTGSPVVVSVMR